MRSPPETAGPLTVLGAGYRFGFLDYNSDQIDLNVNQNDPYLNIGFRL